MNPVPVLAEGNSNFGAPSAILPYCQGFKSNLRLDSAKENAIFLYHQASAVDWDPEASFQAGIVSSKRLLKELERGADERDLRIVISRVIGELCGLSDETKGAKEFLETPDM